MKKETCWNCGLDLIVGEVVHNDTGGDSIHMYMRCDNGTYDFPDTTY